MFCHVDGTMLTRDEVKRIVPAACKRAGLRLLQWDALRHSFASQLTTEGVALRGVQHLLDHATIEMTMWHALLAPSARHRDRRRVETSGHQMGTEEGGVG